MNYTDNKRDIRDWTWRGKYFRPATIVENREVYYGLMFKPLLAT